MEARGTKTFTMKMEENMVGGLRDGRTVLRDREKKVEKAEEKKRNCRLVLFLSRYELGKRCVYLLVLRWPTCIVLSCNSGSSDSAANVVQFRVRCLHSLS